MAGDDGDQNTSPSKMEQIKSTVIEYINYPAWSNADKQKLNKRLLFYIPFYAFIAGLWFLWVTAFHASALAKTDGIRPLLHGRGIQSPGINYVPRLMNSNKNHFEYIKENHKNIDDQVAFTYKAGGGSIYSNAMDDWLNGEGRSLSDYGDFGECASTTYGFAENKPCIFIKINKVVDWVPHGIQFSDIDEFWKGGESNFMSSEGYCSESRFGEWCGSNKNEKRDEMKKHFFNETDADFTKPRVHCMTVGHQGKNIPITTFPVNGEMNFEAANSFTGRDATATRKGRSIWAWRDSDEVAARSQEKHLTPLVAVQFDFTADGDKYQGKDINVHCFVFDRNMEIETDDKASGMIDLWINVRK